MESPVGFLPYYCTACIHGRPHRPLPMSLGSRKKADQTGCCHLPAHGDTGWKPATKPVCEKPCLGFPQRAGPGSHAWRPDGNMTGAVAETTAPIRTFRPAIVLLHGVLHIIPACPDNGQDPLSHAWRRCFFIWSVALLRFLLFLLSIISPSVSSLLFCNLQESVCSCDIDVGSSGSSLRQSLIALITDLYHLYPPVTTPCPTLKTESWVNRPSTVIRSIRSSWT